MPRDYKSRAMRNQKKSLPGYIWLLSGLAIGLFIAFIVYLDKQPDNPKDFGTAIEEELQKLKQKPEKRASNESVEATSAEDNDSEERKFNFYTILPELEVLIPESETRPPETQKEATSKTTTSNTTNKTTATRSAVSKNRYILQVGSFQNLGDAKKLKANLAFLGITANIQHVTVDRQTWHRVRTGPYTSKQELYKNKNLLKQNNISAISMELK
jgi:cell division protein FtsN